MAIEKVSLLDQPPAPKPTVSKSKSKAVATKPATPAKATVKPSDTDAKIAKYITYAPSNHILGASEYTKSVLGILVDASKKARQQLTEQDCRHFLQVCLGGGLDPIMREVYATWMGGQFTIVTGIDGLRKASANTHDKNGNCLYGGVPVREYDHDKDSGELVSATVSVARINPLTQEVMLTTVTAFLSEYQGKSPIWKEKPHVMLAKCAEGQAHRAAFPATRTLYVAEELGLISKESEVEDGA